MKNSEYINNHLFTNAFEHSANGMGISGPDAKWLRVNTSLCDMLGYTSEEMLNRSFSEFTFSGDNAAESDFLKEFLDGSRSTLQREKRYIHKSGKLIWAQVNVSVLRNPKNEILLFISQMQNITERKMAEISMCDSLDSFRILSEAMPQMVWKTSVEGSATYLNKQWTTYTGMGLEHGMGTNWLNSFHPDDQASTMAAWKYAIDHGEDYSHEARIRKYDGTFQWWLIRAVPVLDKAGHISGWVGTCTNIDELKKTLVKEKLSEEMILAQAALINEARDAVILLNIEGEIKIWNRGAERLYGWTAAEVLGKKDFDVYAKNSEAYIDKIQLLLQNGHWEGEFEQQTCTGTDVIVESRLTLTRDQHGQASSILVINRDITEKKRHQLQLLRSQRLESIGTLAGGMAHDLNNLLTPIMMSIELLQMEETDELRHDTLQTIASCAKRGADVIKLVLSFARGVEGKRLELQPENILRETEKIIEDTFLKSIHVTRISGKDVWSILGDETQLQQVLLNLCVNAKDAMPRGGNLTLSMANTVLEKEISTQSGVCTPGNYVRINIEDDGSGMSKATLDRIFEPFFTTKELGQGTGLGLSTSLSIVGSHKGYISVYSELGAGTKFSVYLPAIEKSDAVMIGERERKIPHGNGELVLVVDDEPAIRMITRQTLEKFGYRVRLASGGAEALKVYAENGAEIAVVLTDIMMPDVDGIQTIKGMRKLNPDVRVIAASGLASNANVANGTIFLPKPYSADTLLKAISDCLD